jgi:hypothetical protein
VTGEGIKGGEGSVVERRERTQEKAVKLTRQQVQDNFVACDRCSFFLVGYKILHGEEGIGAAIDASDGRWLTFVWDPQTRLLLQESYGGRLDIKLDYYDSQCPACQRRFVYEEEEGAEGREEGGHSFRIEIKPRVP